MKLSVSLTSEDVAVLDKQVKLAELPSRSAAVHRAIDLLRESILEQEYAEAFLEWEAAGLAEDWDITAGDGIA